MIIKSDVIREALAQPVELVKVEANKGESIDDILNEHNDNDYGQNALDNL